jgi:CheY-like chemotaxis protein
VTQLLEHDPVTVSFDVVWQGSSGKQDARMSEISMDGCFIDSITQGRTLGELVEFKVHLPTGPWISLQGELVNEDYPIGFGLRFSGLNENDKRLLADVVVAHGGKTTKLSSSNLVDPVVPQVEKPAKRQRVLVADDDALTLRMVTAIVETEGFEAVAVPDGREALRVLQADGTFSAAIFDRMMPHLKGLDLILYMKADERLRGVPVGMITSETDPKVWDESVAAGACVFLPKPFMPPQVQMMLRMLVRR